jgi:hypothetical protein
MLASLLAACSGSDRVDRFVPGWANTRARPAPQYAGRAEHRPQPIAESQPANPVAEPQPAKPLAVQHQSEE